MNKVALIIGAGDHLHRRNRGKHALRALAQSMARGVFGAPTFFVDGQMFWGQDRLDFVQQALKATP